jgi:hypothetical protein
MLVRTGFVVVLVLVNVSGFRSILAQRLARQHLLAWRALRL